MSGRAATVAKRSFFGPEVIQTSMMDCGPASLKCLLEGFGIDVGYGRLREACQTDVDGTSIDVLEDVAVQLGLDAEQVMVPADHLLLPESEVLPALVVVRRAHAPTHFVVVWRRHAGWLQIMDPGVGRRWVSHAEFLRDVYHHQTLISAAAFRDWAASDAFLRPLARRLADLGLGPGARDRLVGLACDDAGCEHFAALDAGTRLVEGVVRAGGLSRGASLEKLLARLVPTTFEEGIIPEGYWAVTPALPGPDGHPRVMISGAVLVTVRGRGTGNARLSAMGLRPPATALSAETLAALHEPTTPPWREIVRMLREDGLLAPATIAGAMFVSAAAVVLQALVLRGLIDLGRSVGMGGQRLGAMGAIVVLVTAVVMVSVPIAAGLQRIGRKLETRLRAAFMEKIPRISDRYFHSRLVSDMAERAHAISSLRGLPGLASGMLGVCFQLLFTLSGLIWLEPACAPAAVSVVAVAVALAVITQPMLTERDLRARNHGGALSRFYLDALLGIWCIRAHGAQAALMREQESLLVHWTAAQLRLQRAAVLVGGLQAIAGLGLAVWLLFAHVARPGQEGSVLLLAYWALQLPGLGQALAMTVRQIPALRNVSARLMEPMSAPEESTADDPGPADAPVAGARRGPRIELRDVSVRAGGHALLESVDLEIGPGSHVAIVGESGAGKSTLVGLLLGWHRAAVGSITVDGQPLGHRRLTRLRRETAWVDPAVQLWNRRFIDNMLYGAGSSPDETKNLGWAIEAAELREVLERLPEGLQTSLGEGGALVSGGEAQRVRLGRAMLRQGVRLVILDEPFRGLDRERRRQLLRRARQIWPDATLLCITHDVSETLRFDRVLVVESGRVVEDGDPAHLAGELGSRYAALLAAEQAVRGGLWSSAGWRRLRIDRSGLSERPTLRHVSAPPAATRAEAVPAHPIARAGDG